MPQNGLGNEIHFCSSQRNLNLYGKSIGCTQTELCAWHQELHFPNKFVKFLFIRVSQLGFNSNMIDEATHNWRHSMVRRKFILRSSIACSFLIVSDNEIHKLCQSEKVLQSFDKSDRCTMYSCDYNELIKFAVANNVQCNIIDRCN